MRKVICLIAIQENKVLLVKKGESWICPGGKPEHGESELECLLRELSEELPGIKVTSSFKRYFRFYGTAPHKGDMIEVVTYLADVEGEIIPSAEICDAKWTNEFVDIKLSDVTDKIVKSLIFDDYLVEAKKIVH